MLTMAFPSRGTGEEHPRHWEMERKKQGWGGVEKRLEQGLG